MKKMVNPGSLTFILMLLMLAACGSTGGGNNAAPQPTAAVISLATSGTATVIYGIDVTLALPPGVTANSTVNPPWTDDGVVTASGAAAPDSITYGVYSAASGTFPATIKIVIASAHGFSMGEFSTVNCSISAGYSPTVEDFSLSGLVTKDMNGADIAGLVPVLSGTIR